MRRFLLTVLFVCLLSPDALAQTLGAPGGLVVFETFGSGVAPDRTQAGVLPAVMTTHTVLFATSSVRLSRNLGVAIVNPHATPARVTMRLRRGVDGGMSSEKIITVPGRQQIAKFISELFADVASLPVDFDGSLSITSDNPVAIVGLRFRGAKFSTIPITSLSPYTAIPPIAAGIGGPASVILPQFASGGGWSSEIVLSNTTLTPLPVRIDLFKQDGTSLTTSLNGQTGSSFQNVVIPAEGISILDNNDSGALQVGFAVVTPMDTSAPAPPTAPPAAPPAAPPNNPPNQPPGPPAEPPNMPPNAPPTAPTGPGMVALGAAAPYAVLAGAGVTNNTGPTIINGSLGTSPTGTLTGAPTVTGSTDLANPAAAAAKLALTAAYNDAAGRSLNAISLPGDLSGLTLAPGLYKNSSSVQISGNVTLDAQGDPNATWIFQMGSTLTTMSTTNVVLAGGAKAANIVWQVGSSATLGTYSIFKGNILAAISISVNTGAVIEGRLLTQTGAVTLLTNIVTVPNP